MKGYKLVPGTNCKGCAFASIWPGCPRKKCTPHHVFIVCRPIPAKPKPKKAALDRLAPEQGINSFLEPRPAKVRRPFPKIKTIYRYLPAYLNPKHFGGELPNYQDGVKDCYEAIRRYMAATGKH
jgi:hypothetical protein